ncbi:CIA30 family protein [Jhaorihella thermophila]
MRRALAGMAGICLAAVMSLAAAAGERMNTLDDFSEGLSPDWSFVTDQVMGGVSTGKATLERADGEAFLHLTGRVSTEKKTAVSSRHGSCSSALSRQRPGGLELEVRGNDQTYYVHLRGRGPSLPWQFHQAPFEAAADLRVVRIPFDAFRPRGMILGRPIAPERIRSIAVVAYGRDHEADLAVRRLGWY